MTPRPSIEPLGLSALEAARFVGVGETLFRELVAEGRMPKPRKIKSRVLWSREELAFAFHSLSIDEPIKANEWDEVL